MKTKPQSLSIIFIIPFLFHSTSFSYDDNKKYKNGDFSFTIPKGWKIGKDEVTPENWQYVTCSKKGIGTSGIVMIKWVKDSLDIREILKLHINKFKNGYNKLGTFESDEIIQTTLFNSQKALKINYKMSMFSVEHSGEMYCFYLGGYTVFWNLQGADEDFNSNRNGFEEIKSSFSCSK